MRVVEFSALEDLAPYAGVWDRLAAGVPFRTWDWTSCWWRHYGGRRSGPSRARLAVLGVFEGPDRLVGLAPWYIDWRPSQARVLRWLGSGEVCSDYLSVLCQPSLEDSVSEALADYLAADRSGSGPRRLGWDLLAIEGVDAGDALTTRLVRHLADRGCQVHESPAMNCWRIELPETWEQYLAALSKGHRKQLRRLERNAFDSGRAVLHTVERLEQLPRAIEILVELHQRRRRWLGQRGCFASARFSAFHRDIMPRLLASGQLRLHWLDLDGRPAAAEYQLSGNGILYAYQGGVDPRVLDEEPGRLIMQATLRRAIDEGCRALDFLRGDEPYKAHFRATPRPGLALRVVANRAAARWRHRLWLAGRNVKHWLLAKPQAASPRDGGDPRDAVAGLSPISNSKSLNP
jgi:CelD/BcsL family acetyltransferase involved in cellulose biosynthesis